MRAGPSSRARRCTTPPPAVTAIVIFLRWRSGGKLSVTQRELGNGFCPSRQLGWGVCNAKRIPFNTPLQGSWKAAVPNGSCLIESRPAVVHVVGRRSSGSLRHTKDNSDRLDRRTGLGLRPAYAGPVKACLLGPLDVDVRPPILILARQAPIRGYTGKPPGFLCRQVQNAVRPGMEGHLGHVLPMDPPEPPAAKRIGGREAGRQGNAVNSVEQVVVIASPFPTRTFAVVTRHGE